MQTLDTERLTIRLFTEGDAAFILELVNDADWLRFIGDKNVRSLDDARRYLRHGPLAMYEQHGLGLCCVERRSDAAALGMCGLIKRDAQADIDLGFAYLPAARGQGYAREAAAAMLAQGFGPLGLKRIVAITALDNQASARVLEALGMHLERVIVRGSAPNTQTDRLFAANAQGWSSPVGCQQVARPPDRSNTAPVAKLQTAEHSQATCAATSSASRKRAAPVRWLR